MVKRFKAKLKRDKSGFKTKRKTKPFPPKGPKYKLARWPKLQPDKLVTKLEYVDVTNPYINLGGINSYLFSTYNINGAWDVSAAIGSTAMAGFTEIAPFYNRYRVLGVRIHGDLTNGNPNPMILLIHLQSDAQPSTLTSWSAWRALEGNRYTKTAICSQAGGMDRCKVSVYANLAKLYGNKGQYHNEQNTSALTGGVGGSGANPLALLKGYIALMAADGTINAANSHNCPIKITISMWIEFFDRIDLVA